VSSGAAVGDPGVPQTVMPRSSAASTSMEAFAIPVVTRSRRAGSFSSTSRGKAVRSRMAMMIVASARADSSASGEPNGSRYVVTTTPSASREDQSANPCATSW
jgi:hypothetical protein